MDKKSELASLRARRKVKRQKKYTFIGKKSRLARLRERQKVRNMQSSKTNQGWSVYKKDEKGENKTNKKGENKKIRR